MSKNFFFSLITILVLLTAGWAYFNVGFLGKQRAELEKELFDLNQRFDELAMVSENYDQFKISFNAREADFDTLQTVLSSSDTYTAYLNQIRDSAENHQLQIVNLNPVLVDAYPALYNDFNLITDHVECYPVQLKFYGEFLNIAAFLDDLERMAVNVNIANMSIASEMEEGGTLLCEMQLYTYIYIEGV